jgi:hypothetical protein
MPKRCAAFRLLEQLPDWTEYLWTHGRQADLITAVTDWPPGKLMLLIQSGGK